LGSSKLVLLEDYKKPKDNPEWANISPNGEMVVFSKKFNLYWMDKTNYEKALKNEDDSTIVEHQLTKDGEKDYSYGHSEKRMKTWLRLKMQINVSPLGLPGRTTQSSLP
jgi:hypothetical protein